MTQVAKVFELNRQGFNLRRGAIFAVIMGLLIIVGVLPMIAGTSSLRSSGRCPWP